MTRRRVSPVPSNRPGARAVAGVVVLALLLLGPGAATVVAKNIVCPFATECVGGKKGDTIRGEGQNNLFGKAGDDTMTSAGASVVDGGPGNDRIRAFQGGNIITGGKGNDAINAVNGAQDTVDCGAGKDKVNYDATLDDITNCEDRRPQ